MTHTKREPYFNGGEYFCHSCQGPHHQLSGIGKAHIKYASEGVRRQAFLSYGIY